MVPGAAWADSAHKPMAMARPIEGPKPPEVTLPMTACRRLVEDLGAFAGRGAIDEEADADAW